MRLQVALRIAAFVALSAASPQAEQAPPAAPELNSRFAIVPSGPARIFFDGIRYNDARWLDLTPPSEVPEGSLGAIIQTDRGSEIAFFYAADDLHLVVIDQDGDGDLRDDEPIELIASSRLPGNAHEVALDFGHWRTAIVRWEQTPGIPRIAQFAQNQREGRAIVGGKPLRYRLLAHHGRYAAPYAWIALDLDFDGILPPASDRYSNEMFRVDEKIVLVEGRPYVFEIDQLGDSVSFSASEGTPAPRVDLEPGALAPNFAYVELDSGAVRNLSDHRGKHVALYFWGTWCGGCASATSHLLEAYEHFSGNGFSIIGINLRDPRLAVEQYLESRGVTWPQALEGEDTRLLELYRVGRFPTIFLIDPNGVILENQIVSGRLSERLGELLPTSTSAN